MKILIIFYSFFFSYILFASTPIVESSGIQSVQKNPLIAEKEFIAMRDVTKEAAKIIVALKNMEELFEESDAVKSMQGSLGAYCQSIDSLLKNENYKNIHSQNVRQLQKMHSELNAQIKQLQEWEALNNANIKKYDKYRLILEKENIIWEKTYKNALENNAPKELLVYIQSVLKSIKKVQKKLKEKYDKTLTNSQLISSHILQLNALAEELKETEQSTINKVFFKNQPSLFQIEIEKNFSFIDTFHAVWNSLYEKYQESRNYFLINSEYWLTLFIVDLFTALFVFYYYYLYRKKRLFVSKTSVGRKIFFFIKRPFSTYIILFVLIIAFVLPERPKSFGELILLIMIIPIIRILQSVIRAKYYKYIYAFFFIYIVYILNLNTVGFLEQSRYVMVLINLMLLIYISLLLYKQVLQFISLKSLYIIGKYLLSLFFVLLLISLFANIYGAVLLSFRIINGVIYVLYASMAFYAMYVILTGYIVIILRRRISSISHMLDKYAQKIEATTMYLVKIWMILWWLLIVIQQLSLYPYLVKATKEVLSFSITIGETTISMHAIFDFLIIFVATFVLAKLIRTILEIEVFARFKLPRGAPTAIITTLNYVIIISGVIIAFSSLGVTPQQFALMFGALGVGIGFGLRNIIANFISGIIMVFERPIQIGDTIEIANTMGSVQSIGARSSTVKTFDGSEVIIPNADFISKEIINWTLSDKHRRKIVEFKVDLDNDIEEILNIIQSVAVAHKNVLKEPEPLATFKGFGEYYLEFRLYFWLSENLIVAQSEVSKGVYEALKKAGVKMPLRRTNFMDD